MKKFIIYFICVMALPFVLVFLFSLFFSDISFGTGGNGLESRRLGKNVLLEVNGLYKSLDVEEYVLGVLPGTIPVDYDAEALKMQAVLIRTNVLKEMQEKNTEDAADLSYHYLTVEERIALFGEQNYEKDERKLEQAVMDTAGLVVKSENNLIMALYHEVSIGKTADAKEILGEDISYLKSVESSQDVEAKHYMNLITYTWQELAECLKLSEGKECNAEVTESTENGFVKQLTVGETVFSGEEAMQQFGLTSSNFYVEKYGEGIRFVCIGKGNCLGVSQYGANRMALDGKKMEEIIKYYYKGVSIVAFDN